MITFTEITERKHNSCLYFFCVCLPEKCHMDGFDLTLHTIFGSVFVPQMWRNVSPCGQRETMSILTNFFSLSPTPKNIPRSPRPHSCSSYVCTLNGISGRGDGTAATLLMEMELSDLTSKVKKKERKTKRKETGAECWSYRQKINKEIKYK